MADEKKAVESKPVAKAAPAAEPKDLHGLLSYPDKSNFEYVKIPAQDTRGFAYPDIWLNHFQFKAGEKHFVHPVIAGELKDRMNAYDESVLRSLLSTQDRSVQRRFMAAVSEKLD